MAIGRHTLEQLTAEKLLDWAISTFGRSMAICTSFQNEGMVLLDMAARIDPSVRVITLDTGRLPEETHHMIELVRQRYGVVVETVFPEAADVESMVRLHGPNVFYQGVSHRLLCCHVRKVLPLERKMREFLASVVGLRRTQSDSRADLRKVEDNDGRLKLSPLADWTAAGVEGYLRRHDVPQHPLYGRGYTSIGCAPCTRATRADEQERAGRWWWEQGAAKECGIHYLPNGKARRQFDVLLEEVRAATRSGFPAGVPLPPPASEVESALEPVLR